ncbi:uncharacterized protein CANTADRAFT_5754 [Suhomyces tanzawaensis NRRL Y-17324]|uniref:Zn(2)-C6 fungal-type domain-containing protein n=1 Tax=Suhomyces tanzawaensis NRRL Y-17324 TaxID=984487 RepID=A0A1E4SKW8_9ASCO|nr:uncharacterized protein CANTADRAFT_5754 [Suhomyces tanzawaensis NRRL Y-17324]ODV80082.1 hypothetical protein CANTADRAFT_5754 [Suhomyces tanzawaensis NRRL Y-17324]
MDPSDSPENVKTEESRSLAATDDDIGTKSTPTNGGTAQFARSQSQDRDGDGEWSTEESSHDVNNGSSSSSDKPTRKRKKKVEIACVYCRRSHMICDDSRPCQRCIKRGIGHLCYDEPSNLRQKKKAAALRKTPSGSGKNSPPESHQSPLSQPAHAAPGIASASPGLKDEKLQPLPQPPAPAAALQIKPPTQGGPPKSINNSVLAQTLPYNQEPFFYSEHAGSEFSSLNDFLSMIDDPELVNGALNDDGTGADLVLGFGIANDQSSASNAPGITSGPVLNFGDVSTSEANNNSNNINTILSFSPNSNMFPPNFQNEGVDQLQNIAQQQLPQPNQFIKPTSAPASFPNPSTQRTSLSGPVPPHKAQSSQTTDPHQPVISDSARDKFFLTAADPTTEISPEERLKQVIKAKLEAGLLQPYNYAKGYARLQSYMDNYMNVSSRQRILKPLSIFRPAFRAIARTLKDVDLVLVEESFERMLLDYDRVFTSMAIPACLWRRTGEIYRGNKEFASLVGVMTDDLKDGKLAIYELMSEESAVNFWEKYGAIAFDKGQKAVLTSCNLRTRDGIKRKSCCFSFTIRRDRYNIPSCIVGNFIPIDP